MTPEEEQFLILAEKEKQNYQAKMLQMSSEQARSSAFGALNEQNMMQYQLDPERELGRLHHILSGHFIKAYPDGSEKWTEATDERNKILSEYGINVFMNVLSSYITKNNLLSNYSEDQVNWKVLDFANELNDLIYIDFEKILYYPSPEKLYNDIVKMFNGNEYKKVMNIMPNCILWLTNEDFTLDTNKVYEKCIEWSDLELSKKFSHVGMLFRICVDSVHATYLRAMNGEERKGFRKIHTVYEDISGNKLPQPKQILGGLVR